MTSLRAKWRCPRHSFSPPWSRARYLLVFTTLAVLLPSLGQVAGQQEICDPMTISCYMDGMYYDPGDTWNKKDEPCVTFKCLESGIFVPINPSCDFKGSCHPVGDKWTEGCFTYTCESDGDRTRYRLVQGGCSDQKGGCYLVGERFAQDCQTFECQVVDNCYTLSSVKLGCVSAEGCKALNRFWHDTCSVYQCVLDEHQAAGTVKQHKHDIMLWPEGGYALPMPKIACPSLVAEQWDEGYRVQYSDGSNFYSERLDLEGNYTDDYMNLHFCVHVNHTDDDIMPFYQTYWELGRYCILRQNGSCPKGFQEGMLRMTDVFQNTTEVMTEGQLPDGEFDDNSTLLYFCCRRDGELKDAIVLPTRHPFFLFMANNESECQDVRGMNWTIEFFSFDDFDDGPLRIMNGSLPAIKTADNSTLVYLCYYEPVSCGCVTEDSELVALGDRFTQNCIVWECREEYAVKYLKAVEGGCEYEGKCVKEGEPWTEMHGQSCVTKVCNRFEPIKGPPKFFVEVIATGCREEAMCRPLGFVKDKGCYGIKCQNTTELHRPIFSVYKSGCDDGQGGCLEIGGHVTRNCVNYACHKEYTKCGIQPVSGSCSYDGKCRPVKSTWKDRCLTYTCAEFQNATYFQWAVQVAEKACPDANGNCYKVGERMNHSCWAHECVYTDNYWGFMPVEGGCKWRGQCVPANHTWEENCSQYRCVTFVNATHLSWEVQPLFLGCTTSEGKCVAAGDTVVKGCATYECRRSGKECGLYPIDKGCRHHNGSCVSLGTRYSSGCIEYECQEIGQYVGVRVLRGGCKWKDGCLGVNETVDETCNSYVCTEFKNETMYSWSVNNTRGGCQVEGQCYNRGQLWKLQKSPYCHEYECSDSGTRYTGISCLSLDNECVRPNTGRKFDLRLDYKGTPYRGVGCLCNQVDMQVKVECGSWVFEGG